MRATLADRAAVAPVDAAVHEARADRAVTHAKPDRAATCPATLAIPPDRAATRPVDESDGAAAPAVGAVVDDLAAVDSQHTSERAVPTDLAALRRAVTHAKPAQAVRSRSS